MFISYVYIFLDKVFLLFLPAFLWDCFLFEFQEFSIYSGYPLFIKYVFYKFSSSLLLDFYFFQFFKEQRFLMLMKSNVAMFVP